MLQEDMALNKNMENSLVYPRNIYEYKINTDYYETKCIRSHICCFDNKEYNIGADCKLCDQSTGNVCPFHFDIQKLSAIEVNTLKHSKQLNKETLIELFGINTMSKIRFDIYLINMQQKFFNDEYDSYEDYYDDIDDNLSFNDLYSLDGISGLLEYKRKVKRRKEMIKMRQKKKIERDNTIKSMTCIISLEILKNKLNNDCIVHIASFFSGKDDTILNQLHNLKKLLN